MYNGEKLNDCNAIQRGTVVNRERYVHIYVKISNAGTKKKSNSAIDWK